MVTKKSTNAELFTEEFLSHYLKNGIGSMSKSDIDALVMHLLDKYSQKDVGYLLQDQQNQSVSEILRAPVTKIKRLRYEAALKYEKRAEDAAIRRFKSCLRNVSMEIDTNKIVLILEDALAKNWIQGELKKERVFFDGSFNSEIVKVKPDQFIAILHIVLEYEEVELFQEKYNKLVKEKSGQELALGFVSLVKSTLKGIVEAAAVPVVANQFINLVHLMK